MRASSREPTKWMGNQTLPKPDKNNIMQNDEIRYQLLKQLEQNPQLTQRELAENLGVSLGKLNFCLKALIEKGLVKAGNFKRNKHKMRYAYLLTPKGIEEKGRITLAFLKRKQREYDQLVEELEALRQEVDALNSEALSE